MNAILTDEILEDTPDDIEETLMPTLDDTKVALELGMEDTEEEITDEDISLTEILEDGVDCCPPPPQAYNPDTKTKKIKNFKQATNLSPNKNE